jgi:hypothetical protein
VTGLTENVLEQTVMEGHGGDLDQASLQDSAHAEDEGARHRLVPAAAAQADAPPLSRAPLCRWPPSWPVLTLALVLLYAPVTVVLGALGPPATPAPGATFYYGQLAWSKLLLWLALMPGGYAYVALGPYNRRTHPFASRADGGAGPYQLARLLGLAAVMAWAAPLRTLAAVGDANADNLLTPGWPASPAAVVAYNYGVYVLPFLAGCNYWYLDQIPTLNRMFYTLTWPPSVGRYRGTDWAVLAAIVGVAAALVGFHLWALAVTGLLVYYGPAFLVVLAALVAGATLAPRLGRHLHLHHYTLFGVLLMFTPFQNPVSAIVQAALAGFFVDGVASWGCAALFPRDATPAR